MKAPSSQLGSAALALGARVAGGAAVAFAGEATPVALNGTSVDLASVIVGGALLVQGKQWKKFGMWLAIIGAVDYLSPVIAPTIVNAAPQLQGKVL